MKSSVKVPYKMSMSYRLCKNGYINKLKEHITKLSENEQEIELTMFDGISGITVL